MKPCIVMCPESQSLNDSVSVLIVNMNSTQKSKLLNVLSRMGTEEDIETVFSLVENDLLAEINSCSSGPRRVVEKF